MHLFLDHTAITHGYLLKYGFKTNRTWADYMLPAKENQAGMVEGDGILFKESQDKKLYRFDADGLGKLRRDMAA